MLNNDCFNNELNASIVDVLQNAQHQVEPTGKIEPLEDSIIELSGNLQLHLHFDNDFYSHSRLDYMPSITFDLQLRKSSR